MFNHRISIEPKKLSYDETVTRLIEETKLNQLELESTRERLTVELATVNAQLDQNIARLNRLQGASNGAQKNLAVV